MGDRELKDQGNKLYLAKRYEDAIACYTKAIVIIFNLVFNLISSPRL